MILGGSNFFIFRFLFLLAFRKCGMYKESHCLGKPDTYILYVISLLEYPHKFAFKEEQFLVLSVCYICILCQNFPSELLNINSFAYFSTNTTARRDESRNTHTLIRFCVIFKTPLRFFETYPWNWAAVFCVFSTFYTRFDWYFLVNIHLKQLLG